jgi:hypothetical protein
MKRILLLLLISLVNIQVQAQLENVIVEKYYVADSADASDTTTGVLAQGAVTYRIYIDLKPGYKLIKLFGDTEHRIRIASDAPFFNHVDGKTFAYDFTKSSYGTTTLALDTWLTLGQTTRKAAKTYGGVLKSSDKEGTFIGGSNNDADLLSNEDPAAGIPLTQKDGMALMTAIPTGWIDYGILDINSGTNDDSTIFGSLKKGIEFKSNDMNLINSGTTGVDPDSNQILVAQLTTKGKLTFDLNIQVLTPTNSIITYVSSGKDNVMTDTYYSAKLSYPPACGCTDPHYLEYNKAFVCQEANSCKTLIVCGCTDPLACNYNSNANVNIPALCCYPGSCNDRDITVVCPAISNTVELNIYPNPADDVFNLQISGNKQDHDIKYSIYDSYGVIKLEKIITSFTGTSQQQVDISTFTSGLYWVRLSVGGITSNKMFMKK